MSLIADSSSSWKAERFPLFGSSRYTMPSRMRITRSQYEAENESWVTMKMVAPNSCRARSKEAMTAREDLESRFPVG